MKYEKENIAARILALICILQQKTSAAAPMTRKQLVAELAARGQVVDENALYAQLRQLCVTGEIATQSKGFGFPTYYYWAANEMTPDGGMYRALMDLVESAKFLDFNTTAAIKSQLAAMAPPEYREELRAVAAADGYNICKTDNTETLSNIRLVTDAMRLHRRLRFTYADVDCNRLCYRTEKEEPEAVRLYDVVPFALVVDEDKYYARCFSPTHPGEKVAYRIDKMYGAFLSEETFTLADYLPEDDTPEYMAATMKMFHGEEMRVTLLFAREAETSVYDHFGRNVKITKEGLPEPWRTCTVTAALSPTFYSWVDMFEGKVLIAGPQAAADLLAEHRSKLQNEKQRVKAVRAVVKHLPPEDPTVLFEAQWKAMLAPKEKKKRAKKAAAPEEAAAEEVKEAPAPEAGAAEAVPENVATDKA